MTLSIHDILNRRDALRNLSDEDFDCVVPSLAQQLSEMSFLPTYSDDCLYQDWMSLVRWKSCKTGINAKSRLGMKLCEQFFPNFYDIENKRGQSFRKLWTPSNLEKILRWNRKNHSTPYLSELKRGIYFCCGLTKNTMYRPQMMKLACHHYHPKVVLDPCCGWGGRLLGAVSYGAHYIGFEPNTVTFQHLQQLVEFLGLNNRVTLICDDALNMLHYSFPNVDMVLTSPPYYDVEIYSQESSQSHIGKNTYESWINQFLKPLIENCLQKLRPGGVSCWNVGKVNSYDMSQTVHQIHHDMGYCFTNVLTNSNSKRPTQKRENKSDKSVDATVIYSKQPHIFSAQIPLVTFQK